MTGNEFKQKLDELGVSQKDAADAMKVSHVTVCRNIQKGEAPITDELCRAFAEMQIQKAHESLRDGLEKMNNIVNDLIHARV